jgi:hypothetical protein
LTGPFDCPAGQTSSVLLTRGAFYASIFTFLERSTGHV